MPEVTKEMVLARLAEVRGPGLAGDIVSLGLVSDIFVSGGKVMFSVTVPAEKARELEPLRAAAEKAVRAIPGVEQAMVALTAERRPGAGGSAPAAAAGRAQPTGARAAAAGAPAKAGVPGV